MLKINVTKNFSPCIFIPLGKVFDFATKQLVAEPSEIIDKSINYRSMSIEVQMENGTLDKKMDFSNFGCNKLDMSDKISNVASEINETLEKVDFEEKRREEIENAVAAAFNN